MAYSHKKKNKLSTAIVVLNILIVGIIIMMIILIYMHFTGGGSQTPEETTAAETTVVTTTEITTTTTASMTKVSTIPIDAITSNEQTSEEVTTAAALSYNSAFYEKDLFVGDSISTGLTLYGYMPAANVFAKVGLNPETAQTDKVDDLTLSEKISSMQPRNIYIMLGTNGLAFMGNDYMVNSYLDLIALIEQACPTAKIVVLTIPPVTAAHEAEGNETMTLVNDYNTRLKDMCTNGGYECIDFCEYLKGSDGYFSDQYAEEDGMHFLGTAYIAMLGYIEESLEG